MIRILVELPTHLCGHFYLYLYTIADILVLLNSALMFFIFYPAIPQYRKTMKTVICPFILPDARRQSVQTNVTAFDDPSSYRLDNISRATITMHSSTNELQRPRSASGYVDV